MTTPAEVAPALIRIRVICLLCGTPAYIWKTQSEIDARIAVKELVRLPLDSAYGHVCAVHLQAVPAAAPIPHLHTAGPDRAEAKRTSGGYHRVEWRAR